jgi:hypothetical protein
VYIGEYVAARVIVAGQAAVQPNLPVPLANCEGQFPQAFLPAKGSLEKDVQDYRWD